MYISNLEEKKKCFCKKVDRRGMKMGLYEIKMHLNAG